MMASRAHTCNCGACIEVPKLFLERKSTSDLRDHHTCGCGACTANINAIVDAGSIVSLRRDHSCHCQACTDVQTELAADSDAS